MSYIQLEELTFPYAEACLAGEPQHVEIALGEPRVPDRRAMQEVVAE